MTSIGIGLDNNEYRDYYIRQLNNQLNFAIDRRSSLINLLEGYLSKAKSEERSQVIETTVIFACYAGVVTLLPTVCVFCLGFVLELHVYKELSYITAVAGLSTYFVLRILQNRAAYTVNNSPRFDGDREKLLEEVQQSNDLVARELHGLTSSVACMNLNVSGREFVEKCLVFGIQIPEKTNIILHSFNGRKIRIKELEVTILSIVCGRDWMIKLRRFLKELT